MAMNMRRAFNSRMLTKMWKLGDTGDGHYNADNDWVEPTQTREAIFAVMTTGNKFAEFTKGISLDNTDGGSRYPDYRSLWVIDKYKLDMTDKVEYKGNVYNILQQTNEEVYGYHGYLVERADA